MLSQDYYGFQQATTKSPPHPTLRRTELSEQKLALSKEKQRQRMQRSIDEMKLESLRDKYNRMNSHSGRKKEDKKKKKRKQYDNGQCYIRHRFKLFHYNDQGGSRGRHQDIKKRIQKRAQQAIQRNMSPTQHTPNSLKPITHSFSQADFLSPRTYQNNQSHNSYQKHQKAHNKHSKRSNQYQIYEDYQNQQRYGRRAEVQRQTDNLGINTINKYKNFNQNGQMIIQQAISDNQRKAIQQQYLQQPSYFRVQKQKQIKVVKQVQQLDELNQSVISVNSRHEVSNQYIQISTSKVKKPAKPRLSATPNTPTPGKPSHQSSTQIINPLLNTNSNMLAKTIMIRQGAKNGNNLEKNLVSDIQNYSMEKRNILGTSDYEKIKRMEMMAKMGSAISNSNKSGADYNKVLQSESSVNFNKFNYAGSIYSNNGNNNKASESISQSQSQKNLQIDTNNIINNLNSSPNPSKSGNRVSRMILENNMRKSKANSNSNRDSIESNNHEGRSKSNRTSQLEHRSAPHSNFLSNLLKQQQELGIGSRPPASNNINSPQPKYQQPIYQYQNMINSNKGYKNVNASNSRFGSSNKKNSYSNLNLNINSNLKSNTSNINRNQYNDINAIIAKQITSPNKNNINKPEKDVSSNMLPNVGSNLANNAVLAKKQYNQINAAVSNNLSNNNNSSSSNNNNSSSNTIPNNNIINSRSSNNYNNSSRNSSTIHRNQYDDINKCINNQLSPPSNTNGKNSGINKAQYDPISAIINSQLSSNNNSDISKSQYDEINQAIVKNLANNNAFNKQHTSNSNNTIPITSTKTINNSQYDDINKIISHKMSSNTNDPQKVNPNTNTNANANNNTNMNTKTNINSNINSNNKIQQAIFKAITNPSPTNPATKTFPSPQPNSTPNPYQIYSKTNPDFHTHLANKIASSNKKPNQGGTQSLSQSLLSSKLTSQDNGSSFDDFDQLLSYNVVEDKSKTMSPFNKKRYSGASHNNSAYSNTNTNSNININNSNRQQANSNTNSKTLSFKDVNNYVPSQTPLTLQIPSSQPPQTIPTLLVHPAPTPNPNMPKTQRQGVDTLPNNPISHVSSSNNSQLHPQANSINRYTYNSSLEISNSYGPSSKRMTQFQLSMEEQQQQALGQGVYRSHANSGMGNHITTSFNPNSPNTAYASPTPATYQTTAKQVTSFNSYSNVNINTLNNNKNNIDTQNKINNQNTANTNGNNALISFNNLAMSHGSEYFVNSSLDINGNTNDYSTTQHNNHLSSDHSVKTLNIDSNNRITNNDMSNNRSRKIIEGALAHKLQQMPTPPDLFERPSNTNIRLSQSEMSSQNQFLQLNGSKNQQMTYLSPTNHPNITNQFNNSKISTRANNGTNRNVFLVSDSLKQWNGLEEKRITHLYSGFGHEIDKLQKLMDRIYQHIAAVNKIADFVQDTEQFYVDEKQRETFHISMFLLLKRFYNERIKIVNSLRAGLSCFSLTGKQIQSSQIKQFQNSKPINQLQQYITQCNKPIQSLLQRFYTHLSQKHPLDPLITLQTSPQQSQLSVSPSSELCNLIQKLNQQLQLLILKIDQNQTQHSNSYVRDSEYEVISIRAFTIMELVFLLSELNGRKVKKLQRENIQPEDFQMYCKQNYGNFKLTVLHFH